MKTRSFLTNSASCIFLASSLCAQEFEELQIDELDDFLQSVGVSNSGAVLAIWGNPVGSTTFYRSLILQNGSLIDLGTLKSDNSGPSRIHDLSPNGNFAVGWTSTDLGGTGGYIWSSTNGLTQITGGEVTGLVEQAYAVNNSGFVVGATEDSSSVRRGYVWNSTSGVTFLDSLLGNSTNSEALDISSSGNRIVGRSNSATGSRAVLWNSGLVEDLGTLRSDNSGDSVANAISADGSVVVGWSWSDVPSGNSQRAFRWTSSDGMTSLGYLGENDSAGFSVANDVSDDGSVIVGQAFGRDTAGIGWGRAFRWTNSTGMTDLGTLRSDNSGSSEAMAVSSDGQTVVGTSATDAGDPRPFIWRSGTMLDHENTLAQVAENAQQQAVASTVLSGVSEFALGQEISVPTQTDAVTRLSTKGSGTIRPPISVRVSLAGAANSDATDVALAGVTAAAALSPNLTFGGYLGLGQEIGSLEGFGIDGNFNTVGLYLRGNPTGGTGLTWKLALAQTGSDVEITRAASLANTEAGSGDSSMKSRAASFELGYSFLQGNTTLTPFAKITRTTYERDGYTENNGIAFPVTYDAHKQDATFATLGLNADFVAGERGMIRLSGGMEFDLHRSENPVTGTSAIPGATSFSVASPKIENENRAFASARYTHALGNGAVMDFSVGFQQSAYSNKPTALAAIGYQMSF